MVELLVPSSLKNPVKSKIKESSFKLKQSFNQSSGMVLQNTDVKACVLHLRKE